MRSIRSSPPAYGHCPASDKTARSARTAPTTAQPAPSRPEKRPTGLFGVALKSHCRQRQLLHLQTQCSNPPRSISYHHHCRWLVQRFPRVRCPSPLMPARTRSPFGQKMQVDKLKRSVTSSLLANSVLVQSSVMAQVTLAIRPLVSVVTPFYNTARYLAQCIESVLTQSYGEFEYILMDNCSTDASAEIAESYARRDPRMRVIRSSEFASQLRNYNRALAEISDASQYCKIVQADDYIFPQCLELMVQAFQQSNSIGLVSSYRLYGDMIGGAGYPYPTPILPGRECGRFCLRTGIYVFGSQTTVMYRSSLVRAQNPFYNESISYADLEKCMEILTHW